MAKIVLLASLKEIVGAPLVEVEANTVREALRRAVEKYPGLGKIIDAGTLQPRPGFIMFVDGRDIRLIDPDEKADEIVVLPVNHGGDIPEELEVEEVSWNDIEDLASELASKITASGYKPDIIVGIIRGGLIPARILSDILGVDDIGTIEIKLYEGVGIKGERPYLRQPLTLPINDRNVLIVDDISDSGLTLETALGLIELYMPRSVRTATLFVKPWTKLVPDYYVRETQSWIVFPWEKHEFKREKID